MRLRTIDGLRGIAAMAVVLYHLNLAVLANFEQWIHPWLAAVLGQGSLGVDVFFVLSGFVIPFSVRNARLSLSFLGRFAVRRSIRLDPPYWAAIGLEVVLIAIGLRLAIADTPLPSVPQVLSHLVYAQNILGYGDIVDVFWTLCFEIQFYIGLIALLVLGRSVEERLGARVAVPLAWLTFAVLYVVSVFGRFGVFGVEIHGAFALIRWFQFFIGCCVYWTIAGKISPWTMVATWAFLAIVLVAEGQSWLQLTPIATAALLWYSHQKDEMATILSGRTVQFLGAISYSLYLFHASIVWRWAALTSRFTGADASLVVVLAVFLSGCALAIGGSWLAWKFLELPSMHFSKRVGIPRKA